MGTQAKLKWNLPVVDRGLKNYLNNSAPEKNASNCKSTIKIKSYYCTHIRNKPIKQKIRTLPASMGTQLVCSFLLACERTNYRVYATKDEYRKQIQ